MTPRYTITPFGTNQQSKPLGLARVMRREAKMLRRAGRAKKFSRRLEDKWGPGRSYKDILEISKRLIQTAEVPYSLVIGVNDGVDTGIRPLLKLRKVDVGYPIAVTDGTPAVDVIVGAVMAEYGKAFGLYNAGICANKPGEHSKCNAWDVGVRGSTADEIHQRVLIVANFLRNAMLRDLDGEPGGLPVNGVIGMSQICDRSSTDWRYYSGTPHVSHVHVSGHPSLAGWI